MRVDTSSSAVLEGDPTHLSNREKRRHERFPVTGSVQVYHHDGERPFGAWLANISCGGAFLQAERIVPEGSAVRIVFGKEGGYDLEAEVVRTVDPIHDARTTLGLAVKFAHELPAS